MHFGFCTRTVSKLNFENVSDDCRQTQQIADYAVNRDGGANWCNEVIETADALHASCQLPSDAITDVGKQVLPQN